MDPQQYDNDNRQTGYEEDDREYYGNEVRAILRRLAINRWRVEENEMRTGFDAV